VERRQAKDVLVYTSLPVDQPIDVVGFAEVNLFISSDAPDTDFHANLVDLAPDGRAYLLNGSVQRARWRDGYDAPHFMQQGQVYKMRVGPFWVSNRFERGHRIRVDVTSSSFPRWERNLNTGGRNYDEAVGRVARNVVHFGGISPSQLVLPIVDLNDRSRPSSADRAAAAR
jgi:putative CocE/NonD family hydrolase